MLDFIIAVAVACVPLLAAWVTSQAVPWIRARTTAEQRRNIMRLVRTAVYAAQQIFKDMANAGAEKKQYVKDMLKVEGVRLPESVIDEMIEAAVLEMHAREKWGLAGPVTVREEITLETELAAEVELEDGAEPGEATAPGAVG